MVYCMFNTKQIPQLALLPRLCKPVILVSGTVDQWQMPGAPSALGVCDLDYKSCFASSRAMRPKIRPMRQSQYLQFCTNILTKNQILDSRALFFFFCYKYTKILHIQNWIVLTRCWNDLNFSCDLAALISTQNFKKKDRFQIERYRNRNVIEKYKFL